MLHHTCSTLQHSCTMLQQTLSYRTTPPPRQHQGRKARYVPGWDCHGLPIELKVLQSMSEEQREGLTSIKLRRKARDFALKTVEKQKEQFKRCVGCGACNHSVQRCLCREITWVVIDGDDGDDGDCWRCGYHGGVACAPTPTLCTPVLNSAHNTHQPSSVVSAPTAFFLCFSFALPAPFPSFQSTRATLEHTRPPRWGVWGDWEAPYLTLNPAYEAAQLSVFGRMVLNGHIYRGRKPVHWSPSSGTALAEAELEYPEAHMSRSIYVAMPLVATGQGAGDAAVEALQGSAFAIWTTTPWTIPANLAVAVNDQLEYSVVEASVRCEKRAHNMDFPLKTSGLIHTQEVVFLWQPGNAADLSSASTADSARGQQAQQASHRGRLQWAGLTRSWWWLPTSCQRCRTSWASRCVCCAPSAAPRSRAAATGIPWWIA